MLIIFTLACRTPPSEDSGIEIAKGHVDRQEDGQWSVIAEDVDHGFRFRDETKYAGHHRVSGLGSGGRGLEDRIEPVIAERAKAGLGVDGEAEGLIT